jgi:hypothetical protein
LLYIFAIYFFSSDAVGADKKVLETYSDCKDILSTMSSPTSGIYDITLWNSKTKIKVYCDMETDGGGWTVSVE